MANNVELFSCPNCGADVQVRAAGHTVNVFCNSCHAQINPQNKHFQEIVYYQQSIINVYQPALEIGSKGVLENKTWEVIGFVIRKEDSFYWREYLLFNPYYGFRFLVEVNGHWVCYKRITQRPDKLYNKKILSINFPTVKLRNIAALFLEFEGEKFNLYNVGSAQIVYVLGEFYWELAIFDTTYTAELVSKNKIISLELEKTELNVSIGSYIPSAELSAAFPVTKHFPKPKGIFSIQPITTWEYASLQLSRIGLLIIGLFILLFIIENKNTNPKLLLEEQFATRVDSVESFVSKPFTVVGGKTNLEFELRSPVDNSWLETELVVMNKQTGQTYTLGQSVSYYYGYDSEGKWDEGKQIDEKVLPAIEPGEYYFAVTPVIPQEELKIKNPDAVVQIFYRVRQDVVMYRNFIIPFLTTVAMTVGCYIFYISINSTRWNNSSEKPDINYDDD